VDALFARLEALRRSAAHQPCFCEENVWLLLDSGALPEPAAAVFVTNHARQVAMWGQRAARREPIVWDYHVVALLPKARIVLDLDDRERFAWPLADWLAHAFRTATPPAQQPCFRVVPQAAFLATFSSDRRHMRDATGRELQPFPPWPAPFRRELGHTLPRFLDLADDVAGVVTDADGLLKLGAR
jgi:protein N-terminal glutamine amidohydrolase